MAGWIAQEAKAIIQKLFSLSVISLDDRKIFLAVQNGQIEKMWRH